MKVSNKMLGGIIFIFSIIAIGHYVYAHIFMGMILVPDLMVGLVIITLLAIAVAMKFLDSARFIGIALIIGGVAIGIHWYFSHLTKYFNLQDESQLYPELGVVVIGSYIVGGMLIYKILKVK